MAALQLAFCTEIGFGTSRNTTSSWELLQQSGKKKTDVLRLCNEAVYYLRIHKSRRLFDRSVWADDPIVTPIWDHYYWTCVVREAAVSYEEEIAGREAAGYGSLIWHLSFLCGVLCMKSHDYEKAEEMYMKRLNLYRKWRPFRNWPIISDIWNGSDDTYGYHVAKARKAQFRYKDATEAIIKHSRSVMRNPNGIEVWFHPFNAGQRHVDARVQLAKLMVKQGRLDDALKMDMPSDLRDLRNMGAQKDGDYVNKTLKNTSALVDALYKEKRLDQATTVCRKQFALIQAIFGVEAEEAVQAMCKLGSLLSHQNAPQINEAIGLLNTVCQKVADPCNPIRLQATYTLVFAICRQGDIAGALDTIRKARKTIIGSLGSENLQSMGCMSHLACNLNIFMADDMSKLASVQEDFLDICAQSNHIEIQRATIPLIVALSRPGAIAEALQLMRELLKLMEEFDQSTKKSYFTAIKSFAFLLSSEAYLFEHQAALLEATNACTCSVEMADKVFGPQSLEYLEAINLMVSVCAKRTMLLYQNHGFGPKDFALMDWTLENHRKLVVLSVGILGEEHDETLAARLKCAHMLSEHGTAFKIQTEKAEAESIIWSIFELKRRNLGDDDGMTLWIRSQLEVVQYRHGNRSSKDAEQFQRFYLQELEERLDSAPLYRMMQKAQLASMLLNSGNYGHEAYQTAREVYDYYNEFHGKLHPTTIKALEIRGSLLQRTNQAEVVIKARDTFWRAKAIFTDIGDHPSVLWYRNKLIGALEQEQKDKNKVLKMQEEVLACMINTRGKQNTATIGVMIQLSQLLLARSMRLRAFVLLKEALELAADLIGIQHRLCNLSWTYILTAIEYTEADKEILRGKIQRDLVLRLHPKSQVDASYAPIQVEEEIVHQALVAGLSYRILGEDHPFSLKSKRLLLKTLMRRPEVQPTIADETIGHILECVILPPGTDEFLNQYSVGQQAL